MSICTYVTDKGYYYAVEQGQPEHTVSFGEGLSPEEAGRDLTPTQYQTADFSCKFPSPSELHSYFAESVDEDESISWGSDEDDEAAEKAHDADDDDDDDETDDNYDSRSIEQQYPPPRF